MRAIFDRPNSTFLDLPIRYAVYTPSKLPTFKRLESISSMKKSTVICIVYTIIILILLGVLTFLLVRYNGKIITFPRFQ